MEMYITALLHGLKTLFYLISSNQNISFWKGERRFYHSEANITFKALRVTRPTKSQDSQIPSTNSC